MKNAILAVAMLLMTGAAVAAPQQGPPPGPQGHALRIVLSRHSTVDPVEIVKHLNQKCPGVTLTTNEKQSDYMLNAWGWSGNYRFMVIGHGGAMLYATDTALLSNAVKDVCKYLTGQAGRGGPENY